MHSLLEVVWVIVWRKGEDYDQRVNFWDKN